MNLQQNDVAPDVIMLNLQGRSVPLASMWKGGQNVLLVFLRHLG